MMPLSFGLHAEAWRAAAQLAAAAWVQSGLLLALGLILGSTLLRRRPMARSTVYRATLVAAVLTPLLSLALGDRLPALWRVGVTESTIAASQTPKKAALAVVRDRGVALAPPVATPRATATATAPRDSNPSRSPIPLHVAALLLWAAGSGALLLWLLVCHLCVASLRRRALPPVDTDVVLLLHRLCQLAGSRVPEILTSPRVRSPFLTGVHQPAILLPVDHASRFEGAALDAVLTHELAHLAHRDLAWHLTARIACAIGWAQPLFWLLCRQMEQTSEEVCDRTVTEQICAPREYARFLLRLAEHLFPTPPERAAGLGLMPFRSSLGRRIQQIIHGPRESLQALSQRGHVAILVGTAGLMTLCVCLVTGASAAPEGIPPRAAENDAVTIPADRNELHARGVLANTVDVRRLPSPIGPRPATTSDSVKQGTLDGSQIPAPHAVVPRRPDLPTDGALSAATPAAPARAAVSADSRPLPDPAPAAAAKASTTAVPSAAKPATASAPSPARASVAATAPPKAEPKPATGKTNGVRTTAGRRIADVGVLDLRSTPAAELARIEVIEDVGVLILDEAQKGRLKAQMNDVGLTAYARADARLSTEPLLELSRAVVEAMPRGQKLLVLGVVLLHPDVSPSLLKERFASLHIVGVLIAAPATRLAIPDVLKLDGLSASLTGEPGQVAHSMGDLELTTGYLERLPDNVLFVNIGDTTIAPDVTEALLGRKIRSYYNIGDTSGPAPLLEFLRSRCPTNLGDFSPSKE
jgi:beta-lactamase regulating signal transducer with metallopeptidase domain